MTRRAYHRAESPLARRIKAAVADSPYPSVKHVEIAAGLPALALGALIRTPERQSAERRLLVMMAVEAYLDLPVAEVAALAGINEDGTDRAPPGPLDGLMPEQTVAAEAFRTLAAGLYWPGLDPDPFTVLRWPPDLRGAWRTLRRADADFLRRGIRSPQPSFTVWRVLVDDESATWLSPKTPTDLGRLERLAFLAGLDALAEAAVPVREAA